MWEAVLKLTMDYKMTKYVLNNRTLKESRTWLLVRTWYCYFISFNNEHPVGRAKYYKKTYGSFFDEVKIEITGDQKRSNFPKIGLFSQKLAIISITVQANKISK